MRYSKFLLLVPMLALGACDDDGLTVQAAEPAALIRFVNTVVDTGAVDLSFVDKVENLPFLKGVAFRGSSGAAYQRVSPGAPRPSVVFPSSNNINLTSIRLLEQPVNLAVNNRYTLVYAGRAGAGAPAGEQHRLAVIDDAATLPSPAAGSIALQVLHASVAHGNVDVYVVPVASTTAATPDDFATNHAAVFQNVSFLSKSPDYITVPVRPSGGFYRFVVTAAGSTTALFAATPNQPGIAQTPGASYGPGPGMQISGSVMTAVVAPGSTPGTRGSAAANQTPTVFVMLDKELPVVQ